MKLRNLINYLEGIAPPAYQESYDNSGLIVGNPNVSIKGVLICLDSTEEIIEEAEKRKCNVVVAHHPIVFKGLKKLNGKNYVERVVMSAIKKDIAIYAIHTNLDNVLSNGVNAKIAEKIGLTNTSILAPKRNLKKVQLYLNEWQARLASKISFGKRIQVHKSLTVNNAQSDGAPELKFEAILPQADIKAFLGKVKKKVSSSEFEYEVSAVENQNPSIGSGMIGLLPRPIKEKTFLKRLKDRLDLSLIRHTNLVGGKVSKVAICGGSGSFLLPQAMSAGADFFVTADYKYHEFFDAEEKIVIADVGHYESERFTIELLYQLITKKFSNFATHCTNLDTNPVNYY